MHGNTTISMPQRVPLSLELGVVKFSPTELIHPKFEEDDNSKTGISHIVLNAHDLLPPILPLLTTCFSETKVLSGWGPVGRDSSKASRPNIRSSCGNMKGKKHEIVGFVATKATILLEMPTT